MRSNRDTEQQPQYARAIVAGIIALNQNVDQLHNRLRTTAAARQLGATVYTITPGITPGLLSASAGRLAGVNLFQSEGTDPALVQFYDGTDADGYLIYGAVVPAVGSVSDWFMPGGISFARGLFISIPAEVEIGGAAYAATGGVRT